MDSKRKDITYECSKCEVALFSAILYILEILIKTGCKIITKNVFYLRNVLKKCYYNLFQSNLCKKKNVIKYLATEYVYYINFLNFTK